MERRPNCSASLRLKDAVIAVRITTRPITAATRPGWRDILLREAIKRQNPTRRHLNDSIHHDLAESPNTIFPRKRLRPTGLRPATRNGRGWDAKKACSNL